VQAYNGVSLEYYSSHNTFNNCTVSGNGNIQFHVSGYDALRLAQDSHNIINAGTFTGENNTEAVILIEGDGTYINGGTINGPGAQGIYLGTQATNASVNNNTFVQGSGLASAIIVNGTRDLGSGNILNTLSSNLLLGICGLTPPLL